jgi:hypothetical protein
MPVDQELSLTIRLILIKGQNKNKTAQKLLFGFCFAENLSLIEDTTITKLLNSFVEPNIITYPQQKVTFTFVRIF